MKYIFFSAASLLSIAALDLITGNELRFLVFYFIPIAILALRVSKSAALIGAFASGGVWYVVDQLGGTIYSSPFFGIWNGCLRLVSFIIIAWALSEMRLNRQRLEAANEQLKLSLADAERLNAEMQRLRVELHIVCAWTSRIKVDGKWLSLEEFLSERLQMKLSHGISAEAMETLTRDQPEEPPAPQDAPGKDI